MEIAHLFDLYLACPINHSAIACMLVKIYCTSDLIFLYFRYSMPVGHILN